MARLHVLGPSRVRLLWATTCSKDLIHEESQSLNSTSAGNPFCVLCLSHFVVNERENRILHVSVDPKRVVEAIGVKNRTRNIQLILQLPGNKVFPARVRVSCHEHCAALGSSIQLHSLQSRPTKIGHH